MHTFLSSPWQIGGLTLPHRLIQGPLAGYSCAPFRELFNHFTAPAYCVSEMSSAVDVMSKHDLQSRYLYRSPREKILAYQLSGNNPQVLAQAASFLQTIGADLIDINCGCPKTKIRKKGAGSALLEDPQKLVQIIQQVRDAISIPLTVKIRIQGSDKDLTLAQQIEQAGADALIVHGRRWVDDYTVATDLNQIASIKSYVGIPVIANGDIADFSSLNKAIAITGCDGFMIGRAGSGKPWLYQELLDGRRVDLSWKEKVAFFIEHLEGLALLEDEFKAILQGKSLVRYYFKDVLTTEDFQRFYILDNLSEVSNFLSSNILYCTNSAL